LLRLTNELGEPLLGVGIENCKEKDSAAQVSQEGIEVNGVVVRVAQLRQAVVARCPQSRRDFVLADRNRVDGMFGVGPRPLGGPPAPSWRRARASRRLPSRPMSAPFFRIRGPEKPACSWVDVQGYGCRRECVRTAVHERRPIRWLVDESQMHRVMTGYVLGPY